MFIAFYCFYKFFLTPRVYNGVSFLQNQQRYYFYCTFIEMDRKLKTLLNFSLDVILCWWRRLHLNVQFYHSIPEKLIRIYVWEGKEEIPKLQSQHITYISNELPIHVPIIYLLYFIWCTLQCTLYTMSLSNIKEMSFF